MLKPSRNVPKGVLALLNKRNKARQKRDFALADEIRKEIEKLDFLVEDTNGQSRVVNKKRIKELKNLRINNKNTKASGLIAVFGSGEMSPTGRRIHEYLIKDKTPPVKIALLETPAGFEENPCHWYEKLKEMMAVGLSPYKPEFFYVEAFRNDGEKSTNDPQIVAPLLKVDYIHTGAGSPTYAVKHLKNSLALKYLCRQNQKGTELSFASAAAIAIGRYCLPVYEIYKAGADLYWEDGLNFFGSFDLNISFIPHCNNNEGGEGIDTSFCYMGKKRFQKLLKLLPSATTIIGIDEQTVMIFDPDKKEALVMGNGAMTVIKNTKQKIFPSGSKIAFSEIATSPVPYGTGSSQ